MTWHITASSNPVGEKASVHFGMHCKMQNPKPLTFWRAASSPKSVTQHLQKSGNECLNIPQPTQSFFYKCNMTMRSPMQCLNSERFNCQYSLWIPSYFAAALMITTFNWTSKSILWIPVPVLSAHTNVARFAPREDKTTQSRTLNLETPLLLMYHQRSR